MIIKYPKYRDRITCSCTNCHQEFSNAKSRVNPKYNFCTYDCYIKFVSKPKEHRLYRHRLQQKKHKYGLGEKEYTSLIEVQKNKCAICDKEFKEGSRYTGACVDHCHITNKVRGLLCHRCNKSIGQFEDNISLLKKAILYLEKP